MAKRFSRYKFGLKIVEGNPPSGTPLDKYKNYANGTVKITRTGVQIGNLVSYQLDPFGVNETAVLVKASKRAIDGFAAVGLALTDLNIAVATNDAKKLDFTPARVTANAVTGDGTATISKITGQSYKRKTGESYTYPFGKTGTETILETFNKIKVKVKQKGPNFACSMTPEIFNFS